MHFQWASDDRWSRHVLSGTWFMLELRHTYEQDRGFQIQQAIKLGGKNHKWII